MTLAALVLLPSGKLRAWLRVVVAKHLFEHRYDYREEWLRFTDTIGRGGEASASLEERIVKAIADITGSPAGLLLAADDGTGWRRPAAGTGQAPVPPASGAEALLRHVESSGYVDRLRRSRAAAGWSRARRGCRAALARRRWKAPGRACR